MFVQVIPEFLLKDMTIIKPGILVQSPGMRFDRLRFTFALELLQFKGATQTQRGTDGGAARRVVGPLEGRGRAQWGGRGAVPPKVRWSLTPPSRGRQAAGARTSTPRRDRSARPSLRADRRLPGGGGGGGELREGGRD